MESPLYIVYADLKRLARAYELGLATAPAATAHAVAALPSVMVAGMSFKAQLKIYEDQDNNDFLDLTGATTLSMYARPQGYAGASTLLATGTLAGVTPASGEALFEVDSDVLSDDWSTYDSVRVWWTIAIAASNIKIYLYQDIQIVSFEYFTGISYPSSRLIPMYYYDVASDLTLPVYPGWMIVRVDSTGAARNLVLPASASTDAVGNAMGLMTILQEKGANDVNITLDAADTTGINGYTGALALGGVGKGLNLVPNSFGNGFIHDNGGLAI